MARLLFFSRSKIILCWSSVKAGGESDEDRANHRTPCTPGNSPANELVTSSLPLRYSPSNTPTTRLFSESSCVFLGGQRGIEERTSVQKLCFSVCKLERSAPKTASDAPPRDTQTLETAVRSHDRASAPLPRGGSGPPPTAGLGDAPPARRVGTFHPRHFAVKTPLMTAGPCVSNLTPGSE